MGGWTIAWALHAAARAGAERPAVASAERRAPCHGERGPERQHRQSAWRERYAAHEIGEHVPSIAFTLHHCTTD